MKISREQRQQTDEPSEKTTIVIQVPINDRVTLDAVVSIVVDSVSVRL